MRATFGANAVGLARVNSAADADAEHAGGAVGYAALWRAHLRAPLPGGGAGEPADRPQAPDRVCPFGFSKSNVPRTRRTCRHHCRSAVSGEPAERPQAPDEVCGSEWRKDNAPRNKAYVRRCWRASGAAPQNRSR